MVHPRRFEERHPGVRIDVQSGGTSQGITDVRRGTADLGMMSRPPGEQEDDLVAHLIARDGIAMIVHRDNPVPALPDAAVREIFTGRIRRWSEVGGPDRPITVVHKADGRATLVQFLDYHRLRPEEVRASIVIGDNQHGIRSVMADPDAIGYVSIGSASFEMDRGTPIRMMATGGVAPSLDAVLDGSFPLSRPLLLIGRGEPSPLADAFVRFARSPEVHDLVRAQYFVPILE